MCFAKTGSWRDQPILRVVHVCSADGRVAGHVPGNIITEAGELVVRSRRSAESLGVGLADDAGAVDQISPGVDPGDRRCHTPGLVAVGPNVSPHWLPVYMRGGDGTHAQENLFVERPLLEEREKGRTRREMGHPQSKRLEVGRPPVASKTAGLIRRPSKGAKGSVPEQRPG